MQELFQEEIRKRRNINNELSGFGYESNHEEIYNEFLKKTGNGFFETKKDIQVLAAVVGFNYYSDNTKKIEQHKLNKKDFRPLSPVDYSEYYHLIYSVALCLNNNIEDILDNKKIVDIFNKCASLGIEKLKEILTKDKDGYMRNLEDFLENPAEFLGENMFDPEKKEKEINDIMNNILK